MEPTIVSIRFTRTEDAVLSFVAERTQRTRVLAGTRVRAVDLPRRSLRCVFVHAQRAPCGASQAIEVTRAGNLVPDAHRFRDVAPAPEVVVRRPEHARATTESYPTAQGEERKSHAAGSGQGGEAHPVFVVQRSPNGQSESTEHGGLQWPGTSSSTSASKHKNPAAYGWFCATHSIVQSVPPLNSSRLGHSAEQGSSSTTAYTSHRVPTVPGEG